MISIIFLWLSRRRRLVNIGFCFLSYFLDSIFIILALVITHLFILWKSFLFLSCFPEFWPQLVHLYSPKYYYCIVTVHYKFRKTLWARYIYLTRWNTINIQIKLQVLSLMTTLHRVFLFIGHASVEVQLHERLMASLLSHALFSELQTLQTLQAFQKLCFEFCEWRNIPNDQSSPQYTSPRGIIFPIKNYNKPFLTNCFPQKIK